MEYEKTKLHLSDYPEDLQKLAREIAKSFHMKAAWPTANDVLVMRVETDVDQAVFIRHQYELLSDWSSETGEAYRRLNPWVLYDAGGFDQVFAHAATLTGKAFDEIRRTRQPASVTSIQAANELGVPQNDIRLIHLAYVFERSRFRWQKTKEGWETFVDVSRLSKSPPSVDELFLHERPTLPQYLPQSIMSFNGLINAAERSRPPHGRRVFIVHGRDAGVKSEVARTVSQLGLDPIILHEQPNRGLTLVEKLEQYADVGFAIVILTPDDEGKLVGEQLGPRHRARQNVVLELGFFWGKLGRERVCALVKGDIEKPSDYDGVVYVPLDDAGGWKFILAKELRDCGYAVSLDSL
jgi:predicted nucleotide-binding protein